jgi:excisionase family DNA binding protein
MKQHDESRPHVDEQLLVEVVEGVLEQKLARIEDRLDSILRRPETPPSEDTLLTTDELAELLKCDRRTVRRLELSGEVPGGIRIGGSKRWRADDVRCWLDGLRESAREGGRL